MYEAENPYKGIEVFAIAFVLVIHIHQTALPDRSLYYILYEKVTFTDPL